MEKKQIKLAILSVASLLMISMTASAILADIKEYYPNAAETMIQLVLTLPALMGLIFAFAAGPLSMRISKKTLVIFSLTCGLSGGLMGLILGPLAIEYLWLSSVVIGVAQGINATMTLALITVYFSGEESGTMMGLQSAFLNGGSMVLLFTSGLLANIKWNTAYLVYLVFLPILLIVIKYLPHDQPLSSTHPKAANRSEKLSSAVYFISLIIFLFGSCFFVFQTNIALLVVSKGYGDATLSGIINALVSVAGMITGFRYSHIIRRLKTMTITVGIAVVGLGMGLIFFLGSLASICVAALFIGFGIGVVMPTGIYLAANAVKKEIQSTAIALVTAAVNLGMFVSPLIFDWVAFQIPDQDPSIKFMIASLILLLLAAVFALSRQFILKKQQ
ncbi:MFS transporter [Acetobacterium wieringae]|uniref:MFS transporter n=1 Tax=Acetobacterium wieringae TaxID=52694 RepID=UPI0026EE6A9D|nr:MFS transporter [Acetobacterium wieringae]